MNCVNCSFVFEFELCTINLMSEWGHIASNGGHVLTYATSGSFLRDASVEKWSLLRFVAADRF